MFTLTHEFKITSELKKIPTLFTAMWFLLAIFIFIADVFIPTGVADGMLYVALPLVGLLSGNRKPIIGGATLGTALIILGSFYPHPAGKCGKCCSIGPYPSSPCG